MIAKTFTTIEDLYDDKEILNEAGELIGTESVLIKSNIKMKHNILFCDIKRYSEVLSDKGKVKRDYTKLYLSSGEEVIVKEQFESVHNLLDNKQIGFRYTNRI